MARLFKKSTQEEMENEIEEFERNDARKVKHAVQELPPVPTPSREQKQEIQIQEVEVTLSLLNQKLNYLIGLIEENLKEN